MDDIFEGLKALRGNWSVDPDGLCGEFIYQLKYIISYPLWLIFRRSLDEGVFPSILKFSSNSPISKADSHSVISNYGSISVQSNISKIFEKLILIIISIAIGQKNNY